MEFGAVSYNNQTLSNRGKSAENMPPIISKDSLLKPTALTPPASDISSTLSKRDEEEEHKSQKGKQTEPYYSVNTMFLLADSTEAPGSKHVAQGSTETAGAVSETDSEAKKTAAFIAFRDRMPAGKQSWASHQQVEAKMREGMWKKDANGVPQHVVVLTKKQREVQEAQKKEETTTKETKVKGKKTAFLRKMFCQWGYMGMD